MSRVARLATLHLQKGGVNAKGEARTLRLNTRRYVKNAWALGFCCALVGFAFFELPAYLDGTGRISFTPNMANQAFEQSHGRQLAGGVSACDPVWDERSTILTFPYLALILYCFLGLAVVCDEYFEPALQMISEKLGLSDDVAGATFMAAGSSAPELFTSISDAFFSQNDIGIGTIVGSAMFNILVIVAMSAAVTKGDVTIDWRPVLRDVSFYLGSIGLLAFFLVNNGEDCVQVSTDGDGKETKEVVDSALADEYQAALEGNSSYVLPDGVSCGVGVVYWSEGLIMVGCYFLYILFMYFNSKILGNCKSNVSSKVAAYEAEATGEKDEKNEENNDNSDKDGDDDDDDGPWYKPPDGIFDKIYWLFSLPLVALLKVTIPNCEEGYFENWCVASFSVCIVWIGFFCLVMVEYATKIGCLLAIDPVVMGVVLLAGGTSVPDMIASMIVARQGQADMAIANAVGSNVFDILLGLGLPWFLVGPILGTPTFVGTDGITTNVLILVGTVFVYILTIMLNKWRMNRKIGVIFTLLYAGYIAYSIATAV